MIQPTNQSFNIILRRIQWILEYYYIPAFGLEKLIEALENKYPVAVGYWDCSAG